MQINSKLKRDFEHL